MQRDKRQRHATDRHEGMDGRAAWMSATRGTAAEAEAETEETGRYISRGRVRGRDT